VTERLKHHLGKQYNDLQREKSELRAEIKELKKRLELLGACIMHIRTLLARTGPAQRAHDFRKLERFADEYDLWAWGYGRVKPKLKPQVRGRTQKKRQAVEGSDATPFAEDAPPASPRSTWDLNRAKRAEQKRIDEVAKQRALEDRQQWELL
jgi:hypothetical protein